MPIIDRSFRRSRKQVFKVTQVPPKKAIGPFMAKHQGIEATVSLVISLVHKSFPEGKDFVKLTLKMSVYQGSRKMIFSCFFSPPDLVLEIRLWLLGLDVALQRIFFPSDNSLHLQGKIQRVLLNLADQLTVLEKELEEQEEERKTLLRLPYEYAIRIH